MIRLFSGALAGAAAAIAALILAVNLQPATELRMSTDPPRSVSRNTFHGVEILPNEFFAWTRATSTVTLRGLDRRVSWTCGLRLRAPRPPGIAEPTVTLGVDGLTALSRVAPPGYETIDVAVPAQPSAAALVLSIATTPTFVPGDGDPRELGVQLERIVCAPAEHAWILPPPRALQAAGLAGAVMGALFLLAAWGAPGATGIALFAAALAWVLSTGVAMYSSEYLDWVAPVAAWIATASILAIVVRARGLARIPQVLHAAAGVVLVLCAAALALKLLALLHPSKPQIDIVFHAHRLAGVLDGRYFFTQPMPGGVQFPYAIGLYVVAAPWASLVRDHTALLRIVVCVTEALASGLLYVVVARIWKDRLAGVAAVVFYHAAPLPYVVIGNANMTYAFGHGVSVIALALGMLTAAPRAVVLTLGFGGAASLAFLSHVGVFPLLATTLVVMGLGYWRAGGPALQAPGRRIVLVTVAAAMIAIGAYYAHFPEVYRNLYRVRTPEVSATDATTSPAAPAAMPIGERLMRAVTLGNRALGWPMLVLTAAGIGLTARRSRDPLTLALAAAGVTFLLFVAFRTMAPVDPKLQRYADEFIDRLYYATLPAVAILAGAAFAAAWRASTITRIAAGLLLGGALWIAVERWTFWIR